jgi:hypothetical protein
VLSTQLMALDSSHHQQECFQWLNPRDTSSRYPLIDHFASGKQRLVRYWTLRSGMIQNMSISRRSFTILASDPYEAMIQILTRVGPRNLSSDYKMSANWPKMHQTTQIQWPKWSCFQTTHKSGQHDSQSLRNCHTNAQE